MVARGSAAPAASGRLGPRRKVHIQIAYMGKGPPGPLLREKCARVEETLAEKDAGTIGDDSTSGDGLVHIFVNTREPQKAITEAWKIVNHLGLSARATIKIAEN